MNWLPIAGKCLSNLGMTTDHHLLQLSRAVTEMITLIFHTLHYPSFKLCNRTARPSHDFPLRSILLYSAGQKMHATFTETQIRNSEFFHMCPNILASRAPSVTREGYVCISGCSQDPEIRGQQAFNCLT